MSYLFIVYYSKDLNKVNGVLENKLRPIWPLFSLLCHNVIIIETELLNTRIALLTICRYLFETEYVLALWRSIYVVLRELCFNLNNCLPILLLLFF